MTLVDEKDQATYMWRIGRIDPSSKIGLDLVFGRGLEGRVAGLLEKVFRPTLKIRHALI